MVHIVMILDESGSMGGIQKDIIKSVNDFITEQKSIKNDSCTFTFVSFSDVIKLGALKVPIERAALLTPQSYKPSGSTALYKAVIDTLKIFENDSDVLVVIVTDGEENSSGKDYTREKVFNLVTKHKGTNGWNFVYLSADVDTFGQGVNMGLGSSGMESFNTSGTCNVAVGYGALAQNISTTCSRVCTNMRSNVAVGSRL